MNRMNTNPAAWIASLVLLLALAVRTPASPIAPVRPGADYHSFLNHSDAFGLRSLGWGNPHAQRPHHRSHGFHLNHGFRFHPALCRKSPGSGWVHYRPEGADPEVSDAETVPGTETVPDAVTIPETETGEDFDSPEEENAPPAVADTRGVSGETHAGIPAVPEPGSLALMAAGILGLAAAGASRRGVRSR